MKSNVCKIENGTRDLTAILVESERVAEYNGLNQFGNKYNTAEYVKKSSNNL